MRLHTQGREGTYRRKAQVGTAKVPEDSWECGRVPGGPAKIPGDSWECGGVPGGPAKIPGDSVGRHVGAKGEGKGGGGGGSHLVVLCQNDGSSLQEVGVSASPDTTVNHEN